ncbi:hypothetical protein KIW84_032526 [Lathyrus oleraceus]|uniref:Reverse transcriptase n=1 Tax=Pisum sativum TaxID=3888 RepID=A0A9D4XTI1_PEA|nr:hypothetical protein KIW84_032526 [Pisum sativum]
MRPLQRRIESRMVALLKEHVDAFTWSCQDMPGSDTGVVVHKLPWKGDRPPEKQNASAMYQRAMEWGIWWRQFKLRLNSVKRTIRVQAGKLSGIHYKGGIEAARRLRQFMLVHTTLWISEMDLIKYGFENPASTGRVVKRQKNID